MGLTERQSATLKMVFEAGGYVTSAIIQDRFSCARQRAARQLCTLSDKGWLKRHDGNSAIFSGMNKQMVYQVTKRTCELFGMADSYARKKHSGGHIVRVLGKLRWSARQQNGYKILMTHDEKIEAWEARFPGRPVPAYSYQSGFSPQLPELLKISEEKVIVVVFDNPDASPWSQASSLMKSRRYGEYAPEIQGGEIEFQLVVYDQERAAAWRVAVDRLRPKAVSIRVATSIPTLADLEARMRDPNIAAAGKRAIFQEIQKLKNNPARHAVAPATGEPRKLFNPSIEIVPVDRF